MPKVTVDGIELEVAPGTTILQACQQAGIAFLLSKKFINPCQLQNVFSRN